MTWTPAMDAMLLAHVAEGLSAGEAGLREGFNCILIEREAEYVADINRRLAHVSGQDAPLFGGTDTPPERAGNRPDGPDVVAA